MQKGFTVIEMMVVIVIIGILATLAIPKFNEAAELARLRGAVDSLAQGTLSEAQLLYRANELKANYKLSDGRPANNRATKLADSIIVSMSKRTIANNHAPIEVRQARIERARKNLGMKNPEENELDSLKYEIERLKLKAEIKKLEEEVGEVPDLATETFDY